MRGSKGKTYLVVGLGFFGRQLALDLTEMGGEVLAVDANMELVEDIQDQVAYAVRMDATDRKALEALGPHEIDVAIVCIGEDFEANLLTAVLLKELKIPHLYARASSHMHVKILNAVGVQIISPEIDAAKQLSYRLIHWDILDATFLDGGITAAKVLAPPTFHGKSLMDLALRNKYGINLLAIHRETDVNGVAEIVRHPRADTLIQAGDILAVIGDEKDIKKLLKK